MGLALAASVLVALIAAEGALTLKTVGRDLMEQRQVKDLGVARLGADLLASRLEDVAAQVELHTSRPDVAAALHSGDANALRRGLDELLRASTLPNAALALDASGRIVARSPAASTIGQDFSFRDYFRGARASPEPYVSEAYRQAVAPGPVVVAVAAGADGAGVIALTIPVDALLASLDPIARPGRELLVVDRRGVVVVSDAGRIPLAGAGMPMLGAALAGASGIGAVRGDAGERLVAYSPVRGAPWVLYVLDDPAAALRAEREALRQLAVTFGAGLVLAGLLAALGAAAYLYVTEHSRAMGIANLRLREATAEAERATRAKSEFLASMSHELRTPLNAVLGFSDVLREQLGPSLSDRQRRYIDNIHAAGEHLLELINDVLDLSKVEAGRMELRPEPVALADLLDPVLADTAQLAAERGVLFDPPSVPAAVALVDPARIRQVLLNLLSNAVKFTEPGGQVSMRVAARGAELRFEVADTGIGIPDDKRGRVFGIFERLHEGRSDAPGTGLGLAISKRLVELHGGSIDFASTVGSGTRFWVVLPEAIVEPEAGPRVLVVDDDPVDAELLRELAAEGGLRVEVAPTAASALAAIARGAPTAVILDLRLPDRRGDEVLAALKGDPRTASIPVLVVTVEDDDGGTRRLGAEDHMTKPIRPERVRAWLARAAGAGGRDRTAAAPQKNTTPH